MCYDTSWEFCISPHHPPIPLTFAACARSLLRKSTQLGKILHKIAQCTSWAGHAEFWREALTLVPRMTWCPPSSSTRMGWCPPSSSPRMTWCPPSSPPRMAWCPPSSPPIRIQPTASLHFAHSPPLCNLLRCTHPLMTDFGQIGSLQNPALGIKLLQICRQPPAIQ